MKAPMEFNRATYGLPVETFRVDAYIALEERLPVVTEFVLRLLRVCGPIPFFALRDYFGFTDGETLAVVESLVRQGLLEASDDQVDLSLFAKERFEEAGGGNPSFTKVELKQDNVTFDLISFTPLRSVSPDLPSDNLIKLEADDAVMGSSVERAKAAYRHKYPEIASLRSDLREKSHGVYSVEDVESQRRTYIPIPVSFSLNTDGAVVRNIDEAFERIAPSALVHAVNEQITAKVPKTLSASALGLEEFIDLFDAKILNRYTTGKKFDLLGYLADVHTTGVVKYPKGCEALFGPLYLRANREKVLARVRNRRDRGGRTGRLLTSMVWLAPEHELWGRGEAFSQAVAAYESELQTHGADSLYVCAYAEQGMDQEVANTFRVRHLRELHFSRPLPPMGRLMGGKLELLLYPTAFMAALFHLPIHGSPGLWAPIGFISRLSKHVDIAHKLFRQVMGTTRYGRRARFTASDSRPQPVSLEDAFPFLNYDGVSPTGLEQDNDDDDGDLPA
jgi:hypothetical protein